MYFGRSATSPPNHIGLGCIPPVRVLHPDKFQGKLNYSNLHCHSHALIFYIQNVVPVQQSTSNTCIGPLGTLISSFMFVVRAGCSPVGTLHNFSPKMVQNIPLQPPNSHSLAISQVVAHPMIQNGWGTILPSHINAARLFLDHSYTSLRNSAPH
jgi:hypothetical protein